MRSLSKLHLNSLYGLFGRKTDVISTRVVSKEEELDIVSKYSVKGIMEITDDLTLFLLNANVDIQLIKDTNTSLGIELLRTPSQIVRSNVAIASAITSYARINMMQYKLIPGLDIYYSDTDSIFTSTELPSEMVGSELGQMKDELDGEWIKEAYFFEQKKYSYKTYDGVVHSIFAGVPRDSITWEEVVKLAEGEILEKELPNQFFHNKQMFEISVKHKTVKVSGKSSKKLVDNKFVPHNIFDTDRNLKLEKLQSFFMKTAYYIKKVSSRKK